MSYGYNSDHRFSRSTNTPLLPSLAGFGFTDSGSQLTRRTIKIEQRREVQITEKQAGTSSGLFFSLAPNETTKTWSTESIVEIEETFE
jgi:hypothetical protein